VERLLGYAESGFATGHKTDCATAAYELVALAADRDAAREVYLTLQQSNAVLASRISTLERELERMTYERDVWHDKSAMHQKQAAGISTLTHLVQTLIDNDPDEPIADSGETVLDLWRHDARLALSARSALQSEKDREGEDGR
jgi:predicted  nucleic acid-binding Zn-ribbon protein